MNGYMGKLLHVDLSQGRLRDEPLKEELARAFVGGSGLAALLFQKFGLPDRLALDPASDQRPAAAAFQVD